MSLIWTISSISAGFERKFVLHNIFTAVPTWARPFFRRTASTCPRLDVVRVGTTNFALATHGIKATRPATAPLRCKIIALPKDSFTAKKLHKITVFDNNLVQIFVCNDGTEHAAFGTGLAPRAQASLTN